MVVAVENQILHDLPLGLGAPMQPDGGWCQGAQAQVGWGVSRALGVRGGDGRGRVTDAQLWAQLGARQQRHGLLLPPLLEQTTDHGAAMRSGLSLGNS